MPPWMPARHRLVLGRRRRCCGSCEGMVHSLRPFFIMLLISLFLSFAIEPAVNRLERGGMRRGVGTGLVFVAILAALGGFGYAMGRVLSDQVTEFVNDAPGYIDDAEEWFNDHGIEVNFDDLQDQFIEGGDAQEFAQNLASRAVDIGATVANTIFQIFTIGLFTFYLVAEGPKLRRNVCSVLPPDRQREVLRVWDLAIEKTGGYIASRAVLGIISGGAHSLAFVAIGRAVTVAARPLGRLHVAVHPRGRHLPRGRAAPAHRPHRQAHQRAVDAHLPRDLSTDRELLLLAPRHRAHDGDPRGVGVRLGHHRRGDPRPRRCALGATRGRHVAGVHLELRASPRGRRIRAGARDFETKARPKSTAKGRGPARVREAATGPG